MQSLLAVGTEDSRFGPGLVYLFGQKRVSVTFSTYRRATIRQLVFCADKLVSLDTKNDISIFDLGSGTRSANYAPPGCATVLLTDPSLDYCFIGLQNGIFIHLSFDPTSSEG